LKRFRSVLLFLTVLMAAALPTRAATFRDGRPSMGTLLEITVVSDDAGQARAALDACFARAEAMERIFTSYREDSALLQLNRRAGGELSEVPPELARILADAVALAQDTAGSFDPTVGPLVELWREAGEAKRWPTPEELAAARARIGYAGIEVDGDKARLAREGMSADLAGFAKGWTLDRLGELLDEHDIERALLSYGQSSLLALGEPEDGPVWRVLVRDPSGGYAGVASLRDVSVSVSESFGESAVVEGNRLGHLIDPRSGMPLDRQTGAVIVARTGAAAEAWSKALLVLPPDEAFGLLVDQEGIEAMLLEPDGFGQSTLGFHATVDFTPPPPALHETAPATAP
jgi:thiamine biosynthesis lipoprotein